VKAKMSRADSITKVVSEMTSAFSAVCTNRHSGLVTSTADADAASSVVNADAVAGGGATDGIDGADTDGVGTAGGGVDGDGVDGGGDVALVWPKVVFVPPIAMAIHVVMEITASFFMVCVLLYLVRALYFV